MDSQQSRNEDIKTLTVPKMNPRSFMEKKKARMQARQLENGSNFSSNTGMLLPPSEDQSRKAIEAGLGSRTSEADMFSVGLIPLLKTKKSERDDKETELLQLSYKFYLSVCPSSFEIQGIKKVLKTISQVLSKESKLTVCLNQISSN